MVSLQTGMKVGQNSLTPNGIPTAPRDDVCDIEKIHQVLDEKLLETIVTGMSTSLISLNKSRQKVMTATLSTSDVCVIWGNIHLLI